jgi:UDP-N-acetylmuramoyl-L-alanyl-D-glutamate--2,6-diaminopimelate ligase
MIKNVQHIFSGIPVVQVIGDLNLDIQKIVFDSRQADSDALFFAIKGSTNDGHRYINQVINQGCKAIVVEGLPDFDTGHCTVIIVGDTLLTLALASSKFYDEPSKQVKLVGVTGTNGKTTTATLLYQTFSKLGYACGLISTVVNKIAEKEIPSTHTTPDPVQLNKLLSNMVDAGCEYVFMEVSSHAIHQSRIGGLYFTGAIFSNITHDHLDYHKTFSEYIKVKKHFFDELPNSAFALTNIDDKNGGVMFQNTQAKKYTYALKSPADFKVKVLENQFSGMLLQINGKEVWTKLIGEFNAYNVLAVYATGILLHQDENELLQVISSLDSVSGRFQYVKSKTGITAIVDYAHTPDALENVLSTIATIRSKSEKVITVVGCGGDRDSAKRPEMARIACEMSDQVILTSDNPRTEDPNIILTQMMEGVPSSRIGTVLSIVDRAQAIKTAVSFANSGDIILVAGKGHETYQEIHGVKHEFDDLEVIKNMFDLIKK